MALGTGPIIVNGQLGFQTARQALAYQGKYFVCTNPTPGTAVVCANAVAFSATANGLFSISNNNAVGGANIQLDRLKLIQTATAPANNLVTRFEVYNEASIMAISGNALAVTPVNVNSAYANTTGARVTFFSAGLGTVPAAAGSRRLVGVGSLASGVNVRYDSWTIEFGADSGINGTVGLTAARATDPADLVTWGPAVTIVPGTSVYMNLWGVAPDTNVPSLEFSLGFSEL